MSIEPLAIAITLILGLAMGALVGWLASRPAQTRLRAELEKDRAVHAERLLAYHDAEAKLREAFQALSADALKTNNEAFLSLAETRLREARTEAAGDIETIGNISGVWGVNGMPVLRPARASPLTQRG